MAQRSINCSSILPNLDSNERGGLAIYENVMGWHDEKLWIILCGYEIKPTF